MKECDTLRKFVRSNIQQGSTDVDENGIDMRREALDRVDETAVLDQSENVIILNEPKKINLSPVQIKLLSLSKKLKVVNYLGTCKVYQGLAKRPQLRRWRKLTGLRVPNCGSTGTGSAHCVLEVKHYLLVAVAWFK